MVEDKCFNSADNDDLPQKLAEQTQVSVDDRQLQPAANFLLDEDGWPSLDSRCDKF